MNILLVFAVFAMAFISIAHAVTEDRSDRGGRGRHRGGGWGNSGSSSRSSSSSSSHGRGGGGWGPGSVSKRSVDPEQELTVSRRSVDSELEPYQRPLSDIIESLRERTFHFPTGEVDNVYETHTDYYPRQRRSIVLRRQSKRQQGTGHGRRIRPSNGFKPKPVPQTIRDHGRAPWSTRRGRIIMS